MRWTTGLLLTGLLFMLAACGDKLPFRSQLPFPTPGHELVVLVQPGPLSYSLDDSGNAVGLEHDLVETFALELGVGVKYLNINAGDTPSRLNDSDYHLAIGWFSPRENESLSTTPPLYQSQNRLLQHEASLPLSSPEQLAGQTVHVMAGSQQAHMLKQLAQKIPELTVKEVATGDILDLLESLGERRIEYVLMDAMLVDIATQYIPNLRATLTLEGEFPVVWLLGPNPNPELAERLRGFVERVQHDGTLARLEDRYTGHVRRLTQLDIEGFLGQVETTLPKFRKHFEAAELASGLDWRLLAALAYQESHWDPNATSYTNVRGIMMLTEETADRMGVSNRLDPRESIHAGARYLNLLRDNLPETLPEPDRTWLALAAYNIGPGHFNAARTLAKQLNADPDAWYEMKRILPLLAQPKYYERLKSGRARGGEAVILVENIRSYYDILLRHEAARHPISPRIEGMIGMSGHDTSPGLKLKR
ncbi:MAG: membrane-bound lytic murein transglycosylase MltF [Rhodocyclales bacterium]|nr:membrane-bound lytic murein transglycosylase MltF [Rhodocyclales bacterium]